MALADQVRNARWVPERLYAAVFVVLAMVALYWQISGPDVSDWLGYGDLFDTEGGWLRRQGRDPLFIALLQAGRSVFGGNGYAEFRAAIFSVFIIGAARAAYAIAPKRTWSIFVALIVVSAFLDKSLVQIREGMAWLLVLWPLIGTYRFGKFNPFEVGICAIVAPLFHAGMLLFTALYLIAVTFSFLPRLISWRGLRWTMRVAGVVLGAAIAAAIAATASTLEFSLQDLGIDTSVEAMSSAEKYAYWVAMGAANLVLMRQLRKAEEGSGRLGQPWALVLGSLVLPILYTLCLVLVFRQFYLPAVTSMAVRLLYSSMQLAMLIVALRGRATALTVGIASGLIVDHARLIFATPMI